MKFYFVKVCIIRWVSLFTLYHIFNYAIFEKAFLLAVSVFLLTLHFAVNIDIW